MSEYLRRIAEVRARNEALNTPIDISSISTESINETCKDVKQNDNYSSKKEILPGIGSGKATKDAKDQTIRDNQLSPSSQHKDIEIRRTIIKKVPLSHLVWAPCHNLKGGGSYVCARLCDVGEAVTEFIDDKKWPMKNDQVLVEYFSLPLTFLKVDVVGERAVYPYHENPHMKRQKDKKRSYKTALIDQYGHSNGNDLRSKPKDIEHTPTDEDSRKRLRVGDGNETQSIENDEPPNSQDDSILATPQRNLDNGNCISQTDSTSDKESYPQCWNEDAMNELTNILRKRYNNKAVVDKIKNGIIKTAEEYLTLAMQYEEEVKCITRDHFSGKQESLPTVNNDNLTSDDITKYALMRSVKKHVLHIGDSIEYFHKVFRDRRIKAAIETMTVDPPTIKASSGDMLEANDMLSFGSISGVVNDFILEMPVRRLAYYSILSYRDILDCIGNGATVTFKALKKEEIELDYL